MDIPLIPRHEEVEEVTEHQRLAVDRRVRTAKLPSLPRQEPVRVGSRRSPKGTAEEADELEQHRTVIGQRRVTTTGPIDASRY
jgi:hypothetical protein